MTPRLRFDVVAAVAGLTPEQKDAVCRAALILGCAVRYQEVHDGQVLTPGAHAAEIANAEANDILVLAYETVRPLEGELWVPNLNQIGVRSCEICGCTDAHGCPDGCWWVGPTLCSQCAEKHPGELDEAASPSGHPC